METFEKRLSAVVRTVFDRDVSLDSLREDEPAWDSLNHLKLIIAFESEFGVRIPVVRIDAIRTLREFGEFV
jgi:acyl carrier protein